jgi:hypothetical protein
MAAMTFHNQEGGKVSPELEGGRVQWRGDAKWRSEFKCEACGTMQYEYKPAVLYDGHLPVTVCKSCVPRATGHYSLRPQR